MAKAGARLSLDIRNVFVQHGPMKENEPPPLIPGKCMVERMDYGYSFHRVRRWKVVDAALANPIEEITGSAGGLVVRSAGALLGWSKIRKGEKLWRALAVRAGGPGILLECRFPRFAKLLMERMEEEGCTTGFWETPTDGRIPLLYHQLAPTSPLCRLHLRFEWTTGLSTARGGIGLVRIARLLAKGKRSSGQLSGELGITAGAVRSYLQWMEDAALVRWDGSDGALRHPLLETLFNDHAPNARAHRPLPSDSRPTWNDIEED